MFGEVGNFYRTYSVQVRAVFFICLASTCFSSDGPATAKAYPTNVNFRRFRILERERNMRRVLFLTAFFGLFAALGMAESYAGNLIDAACLDKPNPTVAACQPSSTTVTFALVDNAQKVYKLDEKGNAKAAAAMKGRTNRSTDPNAGGKSEVVTAKITGTANGSVVAVESIELQ